MKKAEFTLAEVLAGLGNMLPEFSKAGFTLAEILITLGIIGVVAAITIPSLMQNNKAAKLRTQFLKNYSVISQVLKLMENDDVSTDPRDYSGSTYYKTFAKYLTNVTDCGGFSGSTSTNKKRADGCYSYKIYDEYKDGYKYLTSNNYVGDGLFNNGQLMLPDGSLIFFDDSPEREGWKGTVIYVDVNGYKNKPNRLGYDFFALEIINGKLYAMGDVGTSYVDNKDDKTCKGHYLPGLTCSVRARNNTDYFKNVVKNYK